MGFDITNVTRARDVDNSIIREYDAEFLTSFEEARSLDFLTTLARQTSGGTWQIPRYNAIPVALADTKLTDGVDPDATRFTDTMVEFTPEERGMTVARTELATLQTRGMINRAAAYLVGQHAGRTRNLTLVEALDQAAADRVVRPTGVASQNAITAANVFSRDMALDLHQRMEDANIPVIPAAGAYVLVVHSKVKADIVKDTTDGGFVDVQKYAGPDRILANEVGMYQGFRVVVNNDASLVADGGASNVDVYKSYACGFNAVGRAVLQETQMRATGPFDSLGRVVSMGWYGVWQYKIVQPESLWIAETSSSYGNNS